MLRFFSSTNWSGSGFRPRSVAGTKSRKFSFRICVAGRRVASDTPHPERRNAVDEIQDFRRQLADAELVTLRQLGRNLAHAVEATARTFDHRETEAEVAGQVAHRLLRHGIAPVRIQVIAGRTGAQAEALGLL